MLARGACALKIDKKGEALRTPRRTGYFSALVEARELTDQGVTVSWVMCSDTHAGKAVVERW